MSPGLTVGRPRLDWHLYRLACSFSGCWCGDIPHSITAYTFKEDEQ